MIIAEDSSELKAYTIVRQDGTKEVVYIKENPIKSELSFRDCITIAYVVVGTVALSMTAIIAFLQLKKMNNGK